MRMLRSQMSVGLKLFSRNRANVFWTFAFPLVLMGVFGLIFGGKSSAPKSRILWTVPDTGSREDTALRKAIEDENIQVENATPGQSEAEWKEGKATVILGRVDGDYQLRINAYSAAQGLQAMSLIQQAYLIAQARIQDRVDPKRIPFTVQSPGKKQAKSYAEFFLPGILGFNLLTMGLYAVGTVNIMSRARGTYRRLSVTPLPKSTFLSAQVLVRMILAAIQAVVVIVAGRLMFSVHNQGSYSQVALLLILGSTCFMSIGYALSSLVDKPEAYMGIAQLAFLGMTLMGGVYFPMDSAPGWMQAATQFLPLTLLLKMLRAVFNDGASMLTLGKELLAISVWTIVAFSVAVKRFRWA